MNGRVAKAIRRLFKDKLYDENGKYKQEADLRIAKEVKKPIYSLNPETGKVEMIEVKRFVLVNANKYKYRLAKKAYKRSKMNP